MSKRRSRSAALAAAIALSITSPFAAEAQATTEATAPLDLAALVREAIANSPQIAAARHRYDALGFSPSIAEAPPDPVVSVSYLNDTVTGLTLGKSEFTTLTFNWAQEVPYPGKLHLSGEVARREVEIGGARVDAARLDVVAGIESAYAELYRVDRSASILRERRELLVSLLETSRSRYEIGEGLLENVLKGQSEISRLDGELERLKSERLAAQAALNATAGRADDPPLGQAIELPGTAPVPDTASLVAAALSHSPEILETEAALRRDGARMDLARRELKPDLIWGAGYSNRGDLDPMVMGTFGVRLPLHRDVKQAQAISRIESEKEATAQDVAAMRLRVAAQVRGLAARVSRADALSALYREGLIPQAQNALDSAAAAYGVGRADFHTLLDDFSMVLTYEIEFEEQRAQRVADLAALERLTGRELILTGGQGEKHD